MSSWKDRLLAGIAVWTLSTPAPATPVSDRFKQLETEAKQTTDPSVLARYEEAVLDAAFPDLTKNGVKPYKILSVNEDTSLERLATHVLKYESATGAFANVAEKKEQERSFIDQATDNSNYIGQNTKNLDKPSMAVTLPYAGSNFVHMVLGDKSAEKYDEPDHTRDCSIITPQQLRRQHLLDLATAEHETGHIIDIELDLVKQRQQQYPNNEAYQVYLGENMADTYMALRMIQLHGDEGRAYLQDRADGLPKKVVEAGEFSNRYLQHLTTDSFQSVLRYTNDHDIQHLKPNEVFDLATKITKPLSLNDYTTLQQYLEYPTDSKNTPPVVQAFFMRKHLGEKNDPLNEYLIEASNPLTPPALHGIQGIDHLTQAQETALKDFNAQHRPENCPPVEVSLKQARNQTKPNY